MPASIKNRLAFEVTADALGEWAFHCHLLYHMEAGMFRRIIVTQDAAARDAVVVLAGLAHRAFAATDPRKHDLLLSRAHAACPPSAGCVAGARCTVAPIAGAPANAKA